MKGKKITDWTNEEGLLLLKSWARDGLSEEQISKNIGISRTTLWNWKNQNIDIMNALKKGKEVSDYEVVNALHKRAIGYVSVERVFEYGEEVKRIEKEIPPDVGAIALWLKNRKSDEWKDNPHKVELEKLKFEHEKLLAEKKYW